MRFVRGFTLPELVLVLLLVAVAVGLTLHPALRQADAIVLRGAREDLVSLFHRARMEARVRGDARLRIVEGDDPVLEGNSERIPVRLPFVSRGIDVEILGARSELELRFGPLGTATFASATLRLRKRDATLPLVVSAAGRVRR